MRSKFRIVAASALLAITLPVGAGADPSASLSDMAGGNEDQTIRPNLDVTSDQTRQQRTSPPNSVTPQVGLFPDLGASLLDEGIDLHGVAFDHFLALPTAGVDPRHTTNLAALRPMVDFDLSRLINLPGGYVHLGLTFFGLRSDVPQIITQAGGSLTGFQTTPVTETDVISILTYEQRFMGGRLSVEAGRTNLFNYFLLPNSLDPFSYYSGAFIGTADSPSLPYPTWGGHATYKLGSQWYLQSGAFEDNFVAATQYGDRFGIGKAAGAQLLAEVSQKSDFSNVAYPSNLEAGLEWNTRDGRTNVKGTGAPATPFLEATDYPGGGILYMQGKKVIWRSKGHIEQEFVQPANIALFGSLNIPVDKPQPVDIDTLVGINLTGFIPGRSLDAIGLQFRYQRLSKVEAADESFRQLITVGPGVSQPRDGYQFEVVGNIQATPAIAFRPIFEYFIHPDNYYPPAPVPGRTHDGVETGFFAVVSLGRLLGTSVKPN